LDSVKSACIAGMGNGTRCRGFVSLPLLFCPDHFEQVRQGSPPVSAPEPDAVRICLTLLPEWERRLRDVGIPLGQAKDRAEQARRIEAHAGRFGHAAYAYRKDFPDSGTLVFYTSDPGRIPEAEAMRRGLMNASLWEVFKELSKTHHLGYVFIEPREKAPNRLIIPFYRELAGPSVDQEVSQDTVEELLGQFVHSWNVHVYANPPRMGDGRIVHTLNAHGRKEVAVCKLRFNGGLWAVSEIAS
jgi:hypothetical protein